MLSKVEIMDGVPEVEAEQQRGIAALGINVSQFLKTIKGQAIVERQEMFILNGMLYQGYNQRAISPSEDQCSDEEIAGAHDIDGTRQRVLDTRRRRLEGMASAKNQELAGRRKMKIAQERDELELRRLQREEAKYQAGVEAEPVPETQGDPDPEEYTCDADGCGKTFNTAAKLRMHRVGSKH
jgi:hypothetical protein